jgi:hypothetical protein
MKIKKALSLFTGMVMAGALSMSALAGCNSCEHVYTYEVIKAATCMEAGSRVGTCGICGETITETIPVDSTAHGYTDWVITKPTATTTGLAVKTCTLNTSHTALEVTLPKLPSSGNGEYTSVTETVEATALREGENTYVYANDVEDIVFTSPVAALGVVDCKTAIQAAIDCKSQIRTATGSQGYTKYTHETPNPNTSAIKDEERIYDFNYTFYDDYVYIYEQGASTGTEERWCSIDEDGEFWAYKSVIDSTGKRSTLRETEENYINGNYLTLMYGGGDGKTYGYGVEDFLNNFYSFGANSNPNGDFHDRGKVRVDGVLKYQFRFSYVQSMARYCVAVVNFTLTDTYLIDTLDVSVITYSNNSFNGSETWEYDSTTGYGNVTKQDGERYENVINVTQTAKSESDVNVENPYDKETVFVKSYGIKDSSGNVVTEEDVQQINATKAAVYTLYDFTPTTCNLSFDEIKIYLRTSSGDKELSYDTLSTLGVSASFTMTNNRLTVTSQITGDIQIVLKTEFTEKILNFNVKKIAPSQLSSYVYQYSDTGYTWVSSNTAEVYVGQTLTFKAQAPLSEQDYADSVINATITSGSGGEITESEENEELYFVAAEAGTYTITMSSASAEALSVNLTVTVVKAPSVSSLLTGTYSASVNTPNRGTVEVTFDNSKKQIIISLTSGGSTTTETLNYTIDGTTLTTTHASGRDYGYSVSVNEAYKLVLSCKSEFEDETETVVLNKANA